MVVPAHVHAQSGSSFCTPVPVMPMNHAQRFKAVWSRGMYHTVRVDQEGVP